MLPTIMAIANAAAPKPTAPNLGIEADFIELSIRQSELDGNFFASVIVA
jgi:hypothetical protein